VFRRIHFLLFSKRIGPDMFLTHWMLYFPILAKYLCKAKFKYISNTALIRPGSYFICTDKISIGENVIVRPGSFFMAPPDQDGGEITIEKDVLLGSGVHIYTENHRYGNNIPVYELGYSKPREVKIRSGSWVGAGSIILPGVEIGENSVIGALSLVNKNIEPNSLSAGNPVKKIRDI